MNKTLQNGFKLLELMAASGSDYSVTELAVLAKRSPSHVCRLLKTLLELGYVEQCVATRQYRISLKILNLAHARLIKLDFRRIGHPFAVQLAESLQAHVYLSQPLRGRSIIVDVAYPPGTVADVGVVVGQIHSVCHSACGKVCAAFASDKERDRLFEEMEAAGTPEPRAPWQAEFDRIHTERLAIRDEAGVLALAAPLFCAGETFCGALGALLPSGKQLNRAIEQEFRRIAEALSFGLGYPLTQ